MHRRQVSSAAAGGGGRVRAPRRARPAPQRLRAGARAVRAGHRCLQRRCVPACWSGGCRAAAHPAPAGPPLAAWAGVFDPDRLGECAGERRKRTQRDRRIQEIGAMLTAAMRTTILVERLPGTVINIYVQARCPRSCMAPAHLQGLCMPAACQQPVSNSNPPPPSPFPHPSAQGCACTWKAPAGSCCHRLAPTQGS